MGDDAAEGVEPVVEPPAAAPLRGDDAAAGPAADASRARGRRRRVGAGVRGAGVADAVLLAAAAAVPVGADAQAAGRQTGGGTVDDSISPALEPDREGIPLQRFGFEAVPEEALQAITHGRIHRSWAAAAAAAGRSAPQWQRMRDDGPDRTGERANSYRLLLDRKSADIRVAEPTRREPHPSRRICIATSRGGRRFVRTYVMKY